MSMRPPHDTLSPEQELRIQLEGAWEVLEQARDRQAVLLRRLASRHWLPRLQQRPELLRQVREHRVPLGEALERAEHRLQQQSGSEHHPLRLLIHQLRDQQGRLEAEVRRRLASLGAHEALSFVEGLEHLEEALFKPRPEPLDDNETILLSGGLEWALVPRRARVLAGLLSTTLFGTLLWAIAVFTLFPVLLWSLFPFTTRFWLTPRRLVWTDWLGGMKSMPLESIRPEGISSGTPLLPLDSPLRVRGPRTVSFRALENLDLLEGLLEMYCGPPLHGRLPELPTYSLTMFPATRHSERFGHEYRPQQGLLVIRSGHVAFLPQDGASNILRAVFGARHNGRPEEASLSWLMRRLRVLPAEQFDQYLEKAVRAGDGELWPAATVTCFPAPSGTGYQFTSHEPVVLTGFPESPLPDTFRG